MIKLLILITNFYLAHSLTCYELLELPENVRLTLNELQTLQPKETVQCVAHLGKEPLLKEEADYIWQSIIRFYGGIGNVSDKVLTLLHWITPALKPEDYENLSLSNIDIIQNFGLDYRLSKEQLAAIADRVRTDFAEKEPEDYTYYDLRALNQILCAFNQSEIERIHPSAYKEAAMELGQLVNCKSEVLQGFATLAVQPSAFGKPSDWSLSTLQALGNVANFIPKEYTINRKKNH